MECKPCGFKNRFDRPFFYGKHRRDQHKKCGKGCNKCPQYHEPEFHKKDEINQDYAPRKKGDRRPEVKHRGCSQRIIAISQKYGMEQKTGNQKTKGYPEYPLFLFYDVNYKT